MSGTREHMIREARDDEFEDVLAIINEAAEAYRGIIPADRWHEPYMPADELRREIAAGVRFFACEEDGALVGVMGEQDLGPVTLVRHAYVRTAAQRKGIGAELLDHVRRHGGLRPMLVGTWADASWAVDFYRKNGFAALGPDDSADLLRRFWDIPERQVETSVVLADDLARLFIV